MNQVKLNQNNQRHNMDEQPINQTQKQINTRSQKELTNKELDTNK